ncbi:MAG TPA: FtsQ-type POTRA domain-containing protein [Nitrospirota bacterium]|nr:FtsQ-type POTRA domain-containing protein [Nitrospirota bacterium]
MRDYKHVTVPKSYRTRRTRTAVKRVGVNSPYERAGGGQKRIAKTLLNLVVVVMTAAAALLTWQAYRMIMHADVFVISGVDIKGVKQLGERELKGFAAAFSGQNIFRVDLDAAARQARMNPWVADVRIHRRLPNRITMVFSERIATHVLETASGRYLMDRSGVVIERISKENAADRLLPVIAIHGARAVPGEAVTSASLAEAMQLLDEINARGGWQAADITVYADTSDSIAVAYGGTIFKMGSGRYDEKLRRLGEVMADVSNRGIAVAYVDLRPERQAAVRRK